MTLADELIVEECILAAARQEREIARPRMIDCLRGSHRPAIRHMVKADLDRGWLLTECGSKVITYFRADSSMYYSDGTVYARYCKRCFPAARGVL